MFVYRSRRIGRLLFVLGLLALVSMGLAPSTSSATAPVAQIAATPGPVDPASTAAPAIGLPPNDPKKGLIYDQLEPGSAAKCDKLYKTKKTGKCTHGPDPAPAGVDMTRSAAPIVSPTEIGILTQCEGDGVSGPRTQVIYAHASDVPDRYSTYLDSFRIWAQYVDQIYLDSAAETGGNRRIRFVTDASCTLVIPDVTLSPAGDDNFDNTIAELQAQGYNRTDRKYMVFVDANVYCGIGTIYNDDQPGPANFNNSGPSYGRTDSGCWGGSVAAHEHMHNLGGVQHSAPHSTFRYWTGSNAWQCVDEYDRMCYPDRDPSFPPMQILCPDPAHDERFDCNHEDYYSTNPPAGSYLATHWNTAQSSFLIADSTITNLLQNPNFETGQLSPWKQFPTTAPGSVGVESCCANHTPGGTWDAYLKPNGQYIELYQKVTVTPGNTYTLEAWVSTNGMTASLGWYSNIGGDRVCASTSVRWPTYQKLSCTIAVPAGTTNFNVNLSGTAPSGKWIVTDDWVLRP